MRSIEGEGAASGTVRFRAALSLPLSRTAAAFAAS
jgi:hypothetical protein